ncbi:ABC transporter permease [Clostridium botulinum]|uniref:Bacitracin ABC transporter permease n=1 Tax=Clostridium botulinum TaxID=1491 RepID=A0A6B4JPB2_CLOBO|nr:ABC transporter permease subunit [Clostridium botulinum]EES49383.1 putative permease [Clostridium botulinum E1 str. 'BoNT E Beluga']MBY6761986.1 ABC transporter permease subunit [Clostridium botulinum]MBY6920912.1 ABC transporter permease subunit [Clostridium botulinum]MCR1131336.1 ABC transporter permease [Clostridium botulinum]NFJ58749.1 bacitracin ABC transporter permease [Clostridium botulinum]
MKLFNLTYNEIVKQFKKTSIKVIIPIILLSGIILPIGISKSNVDNNIKHAMESNSFVLEDINNSIESLNNDKTSKAQIEKAYLQAEKEYRQLFVDYKIGFDDWKQKEAEEFKNAAYDLVAIELVLDGYKQDVVLESLQGVNPDDVIKYYEMTLEKKKEVESKFTNQKEKLKNLIVNNDYMGHTASEIARKESYISENKKLISEYEKLKVKNPKDEEGQAKLEELKKENDLAINQIPDLEQDLQVLRFRYDKKIDYDKNNWKNNSIKSIEKNLEEFRRTMQTEKEFSSMANQQRIEITYDEYVKNYETQNDKRLEEIKELWYGLENEIPPLNSIRDARSVIDGTYEFYVIFAVIIAIIIGGGIVANEFSKGTIRLLLIRPVSRWKVLLSKLLSVLIISFGVVILGTTILVISSGYVYGFQTLKTPLLETINGTITKIDYIQYMMPKLMISVSSLMFITSLVFMISTIAKNTALAVAISMVLYLGAAPLTQVLINMKQVWLLKTLIPYINGSFFKIMPFFTEQLSKEYGIEMQYALGSKQLLLASILMIIVTFVTFTKKDVKN